MLVQDTKPYFVQLFAASVSENQLNAELRGWLLANGCCNTLHVNLFSVLWLLDGGDTGEGGGSGKNVLENVLWKM